MPSPSGVAPASRHGRPAEPHRNTFPRCYRSDRPIQRAVHCTKSFGGREGYLARSSGRIAGPEWGIKSFPAALFRPSDGRRGQRAPSPAASRRKSLRGNGLGEAQAELPGAIGLEVATAGGTAPERKAEERRC